MKGASPGAGPEGKALAEAEVKKQSGSVSGRAAQEANGESGARVKGKSGSRPEKSAANLSISPDSKEMLAKLRSSMDEHHSKMMAARISDLVAKLGLNPQQEARLKALFEEQMAKVSIDGDSEGFKVDAKINGSPKEQAEKLDRLMKEMLTADQHEAYEANKEAERNQRIEARTLRDMASLAQAVSLREDQRDAVYEILQNEAKNQVDQAGESGMPPLGIMSAAEFVPPAGGETTVMQMSVDSPAEGLSHEQLMARVREQEQARINGQVERLGGVLDAAQLAAYRSHLEQGSVFLGP